eukprot:1246702-Pleurochrysis_carterae.AAC.1
MHACPSPPEYRCPRRRGRRRREAAIAAGSPSSRGAHHPAQRARGLAIGRRLWGQGGAGEGRTGGALAMGRERGQRGQEESNVAKTFR